MGWWRRVRDGGYFVYITLRLKTKCFRACGLTIRAKRLVDQRMLPARLRGTASSRFAMKTARWEGVLAEAAEKGVWPLPDR